MDFIEKAYDSSHGFFEWLDTMSKEQLDMIKLFMAALAADNDASVYAYYTGYIDHLRFVRFNECPSCRVEHEKEDRSHFQERASSVLDKIQSSLDKKGSDDTPPHSGQYL